MLGGDYMYVSVLTQIGVKAVDQTFSYHVPKLLENNIKIGVRVRIPFGNMILDGFVLGIIVRLRILLMLLMRNLFLIRRCYFLVSI